VTSGTANTVWARAWADELARAGVREVVVAPGSRSTPLVLALARDGRFRLRVHLDERSAAFFALGVGKASGFPAAVVTTSGSAVANVFPAVVEAAQAETPLLVLTADRPPRLRGADANQAIDQVRFFGTYVRTFIEAPVPSTDAAALRHVRALAGRAVAAAIGAPSGPVHVNLPFDKPLEPVEDGMAELAAEHPLAAQGRPDGAPFTRIAPSRGAPDADAVTRAGRACSARRGIVVVGPVPDPERVGPAVLRFAARLGYAVLADPLSGARFGPGAGALRIAAYDLLLRDPEVRSALRPELIVRVGAAPTSAVLQSWLEDQPSTPHFVVDEGARWKDHGVVATDYLTGDPVATLEALADQVSEVRGSARADAGGQSGGVEGAVAAETVSSSWLDLWRAVDEAARETLAAVDRRATAEAPAGVQLLHEGAVWPPLGRGVPHATVFVSSSMPVRDLDAFGVPDDRSWAVFGNRGASGIDGIVSTAYGVAAARGGLALCVIGDLALFHDQNGLLWSREADLAVVFVLVDNDGGGIFHMLPISSHDPEFTTFFATPHGLDFRHAAALHGIALRDVAVADLEVEARAALSARRTVILRVRTDRTVNRTRRQDVVAQVAVAARETLSRIADPRALIQPSEE